MSFNPLRRIAEHRAGEAAQQKMADVGWGTHLTFPTRLRTGKQLYFQLRLPDGLEMVDVAQLAGAADGAPAFVGHFATAMEQAQDQAGVILVGGFRGAQDSEHKVLATLTVALTETDKPFDIDDFMPEDSPSTLHSKQEYLQMSEDIYRIHRISMESQGEGREPLPMLVIEYVFPNAYGVLAGAFATQRPDMMGDAVRDLFEEIRMTFYLGEKPGAV